VRRCVREALFEEEDAFFFVFLVPSKNRRFCLVCCNCCYLVFVFNPSDYKLLRSVGLVGYNARLTS